MRPLVTRLLVVASPPSLFRGFPPPPLRLSRNHLRSAAAAAARVPLVPIMVQTQHLSESNICILFVAAAVPQSHCVDPSLAAPRMPCGLPKAAPVR